MALMGFSHRNLFFSVSIMLFSLKSYAKSPLQYGKIIFQSKVIPLFLPKCSNFYHSEMYTIYMEYIIPYMGNTVDFLPYNGRDCREEKKPRQNMAK